MFASQLPSPPSAPSRRGAAPGQACQELCLARHQLTAAADLEPCPAAEVCARMMRNLVNAHLLLGDNDKARPPRAPAHAHVPPKHTAAPSPWTVAPPPPRPHGPFVRCCPL